MKQPNVIMATHLNVPGADSRPGLSRSRSSSSPTGKRENEQDPDLHQPSRPTHTRSRSYIAPVAKKPISAATFPSSATEKPAETSRFPRLHLHGRHQHHHTTASQEETKPLPKPHTSRHRYTQSEAQQYHRKKESSSQTNEQPNSPWLTTPISSSSDPPNDLLYPTSRGTAIPSLMRMASYRSYRQTQGGDNTSNSHNDIGSTLRRRATSDPRSPSTNHPSQPHPRPTHLKSPIERDLERADQLRRLAALTITESDLTRKDAALYSAKRELKSRLTTTTRSASELMHRLDDAQETLSRTTESLNDTISSFANLADQSAQLVINFTAESRHLDHEIIARVHRFHSSVIQQRMKKVSALEQRGEAMSVKAEELGRRLENCRTIVQNWEQREMKKRKAWRGVWVGVAWSLVMIALAVLAGWVSWMVLDLRRGTVEGVLMERVARNRTRGSDLVQGLNVPESVKEVLLDIGLRTRKGREGADVDGGQHLTDRGDTEEDVRGLRLLDEL